MLVHCQDSGPGSMPIKAHLQDSTRRVLLPADGVDRDLWREQNHHPIRSGSRGTLGTAHTLALSRARFGGPSPRC